MSTDERPAWKRKYPAEYEAWRSMRRRCYDKGHQAYDRYGGRGISVCPTWRDSMAQFFKDMGPRPSPEHSLDREDNDGDYEPNNCRWVTQVVQQNNKRSNVLITLPDGKFSPLQVAKKFGISYNRVMRKLRRVPKGIPLTREFFLENLSSAATAPRFRHKDRNLTIHEWAKVIGVNPRTLQTRINRGWTIERLLTKRYETGRRKKS